MDNVLHCPGCRKPINGPLPTNCCGYLIESKLLTSVIPYNVMRPEKLLYTQAGFLAHDIKNRKFQLFPVIIQKDNTIIDGNCRYYALEFLNIPTIYTAKLL